jgi:glycosyltransferase 2 family protein
MAENKGNQPAEAGEIQQVSLRQRFLNLRTGITFVLAVAFLLFVFTRLNIDWGNTWAQMKSLRWHFYILAFLVYYISFPLRALRWRIMLRNVGYRDELPKLSRLTEIVFLSFFVNCIIYARLGDVYRAYLLKEETDVSFTKTLGTVLAERVIDLMVVVILLLFAALAFWHGITGGAATIILLVGLAMLAIVAALVIVMWRFGNRLEKYLPSRIRSLYRPFQEGTLGSFRQLPFILLLSIVIWLLEAGRLLMVCYALGLHPGLGLILFASLAIAILVALPATPGGLGLVETGLTGLFLLFLPREDASSLVLVDRTISYLSLVVFGLILFIWIQVRIRRRKSISSV